MSFAEEVEEGVRSFSGGVSLLPGKWQPFRLRAVVGWCAKSGACSPGLGWDAPLGHSTDLHSPKTRFPFHGATCWFWNKLIGRWNTAGFALRIS